jgi:hypothetical protein
MRTFVRTTDGRTEPSAGAADGDLLTGCVKPVFSQLDIAPGAPRAKSGRGIVRPTIGAVYSQNRPPSG